MTERLERQLMDPDFHRKNRRLLYVAIIFISIGGAIPIFTHLQTIPRIDALYQGIARDAVKLGAESQGEKDLLEITKSTIVAAHKGWVMAATKTAFAATTFFWFSGGSLIGTFLYRRKVRKIVQKYAPNQAL
jgi:hypothetical protein